MVSGPSAKTKVHEHFGAMPFGLPKKFLQSSIAGMSMCVSSGPSVHVDYLKACGLFVETLPMVVYLHLLYVCIDSTVCYLCLLKMNLEARWDPLAVFVSETMLGCQS